MEYKGQLYGRIGKNNYVPLVATTDDIDEALKIVKDLAEWSRRYPRCMTYHPSDQPKMDSELIAIEDRATKFATLNL